MYCVFSLLYQWAPSQSRSASLGLSILWDRAILKLGQLVTLQWPLVFKWKEKLHISPFSSLWTILNTFITDIFWTWAVTFHLGSISTEAKTQGKSSEDLWKSFYKQLFLSLFFFFAKTYSLLQVSSPSAQLYQTARLWLCFFCLCYNLENSFREVCWSLHRIHFIFLLPGVTS